jgi:S-adenosylmethionine:tRNA ribosyltransferase-isomerase
MLLAKLSEDGTRVRADLFRYELPPALIAQRPAEDRESARLMCLPPLGGDPEDRLVAELPELLAPGSLVVLNDTRVIPARLIGQKRNSGGRVEVLLVERLFTREVEATPGSFVQGEIWQAMAKAAKPLRSGVDVEIPGPTRNGSVDAQPRVVVRVLGAGREEGLHEVALFVPGGEDIAAAVRACGNVPLPPYIRREPEPQDIERYQTVYARVEGAVAAPTAGLHLTKALLNRLVARGCYVTYVTLHVGPGTFRPVTADDLDGHRMHGERYAVSQSTADAITGARQRGAPVVAIGTTTVRALETASDPQRIGFVTASSGETTLFVQPGYRWRVVDGLVTNFHMPRSTLLALVCAFSGTERVLAAYRLATERGYRFLSYGDAMLLWRSR